MSVPLSEWLLSVPWVKHLPAGWSVARFKSVATQSLVDNAAHDDRLLSLSTSRGIVPKQEDGETRARSGEDLRRYWRVNRGHVVINPMWLAHGSIASARVEGVISPDYRVYAASALIEPAYLATLLVTNEYRGLYDLFVRGKTTYDRRVSKDDFHSIPVLVPPLNHQRAISSFLDRKTAAIDALIAKKERLIELLQEKRQALITQAVTKGLDPNVPKKDSGIPWIGLVPSHWSIAAIKRAAKPGAKTFTDGDWIESPFITDEGVRLIQTGNVGIGRYKEQGFRYVSDRTFHELRCTEVEPQDVLICRLDGPVGRACLAPDLGVRMITSVDNAILKPSLDCDGRYLVHVLSSPKYLDWVQVLCRVGGGFRFRVSRSMLGDIQIPLPPRDEQRRIADMLDDQTAHTQALETKLGLQCDKLREYRQALITSAVTGKIDVSNEPV
jgi:restriction endonuclease S subunit